MEWLTFQNGSDLLVLCLMEIVLGIDNIVFIAIVTSRLPVEMRSKARKIGLMLALGMRIVLLTAINFIAQLKEPVFTLTGLESRRDGYRKNTLPKLTGYLFETSSCWPADYS